MTVDGYQTLEDRNNITEVEQNGPFICNRTDAWLGTGYYFWDTNMEWAKNWGFNSYERRGQGYVIGHCKLNLEKCFDIAGIVAHQTEFEQVYLALRASGKLNGKPKPRVKDCLAFLIRNSPYAS